LAGERVFAVAVGDSRAYRYRADVNELTCLTPPFSINSERQRLLERLDELSSQKELDADPTLHMMFRSRNIMDVELGTLKGVPEVSEHKVKRGDLVFVCSDGVSDNLTSREMRDLLAAADKESGAASAVASALAEAAYARSASTHVRAKYDDISVACLRV
jgi:serine/threonine protein phosphatase PrpC